MRERTGIDAKEWRTVDSMGGGQYIGIFVLSQYEYQDCQIFLACPFIHHIAIREAHRMMS